MDSNLKVPRLSYIQVTRHNLDRAIQLQQTVWPHNPVDRDYLLKAEQLDDDENISWLVYHHKNHTSPNKLIGLTGVYTYDPDEPGYDGGESIWMDWFCLLPEFRGMGLGEMILRYTISYAQHLGRFKYFRLDTSDFPDRASTKLYDRVMQMREPYTAEPYPEGYQGLIYSYSLDGSPIKPWDNRLLDLSHYGSLEADIV